MTTVAAVVGVGIVGALLLGLSNRQKTVIEQGKLSSRVWQGSEYGGDIPRMYGTVGLEGSQIVWLEHNKLKEVVKKKKSGGKGGGGGTVTKTYTYFATFALMLCQGEVAGVRRIWCGDKLIYNAGSDDLETIIASNQAAKSWKLYRGTDDQLPDPRYEADVGVGNAPAFRGYTYMVFYDFALADYSNTLQAAQFKVEVVASTNYATEKVYDVADSNISANSTLIINGRPGEIARTFGYKSQSAVDPFMHVHRTSGMFTELNPFTYTSGTLFAEPVIATGDIDYCYIATVGRVITDKGVFSGFPFNTSNSGFRVHYFDGHLALLWTGSTGSGVIHLQKDGQVSTAGNTYRAMAEGNGVLYGITETQIVTLSLADLSVLNSVPYSSSYTIGAASTYIAFDNGVLWLLPTNNLTVLQGYDPQTGTKLYNIASSLFYPASLGTNGQPGYVKDGMLYRQNFGSGTSTIQGFIIASMQSQQVALSDVMINEATLSSLITPFDLDISLLTQNINGYRVSGGTIRSVIEPLQGAYPFNVVPSGYKIKFVPRGQAPVITIPWEDLAAANGDEIGDSLPYSREMDSQLPQKVTITALSSTREYGASTQSYERLNTSAVNVEQRDIPLVLSDDEIAQMAEKLLFLRWLERDDFSFSLPPTYLALEPADVVTVQAKFGTFELRLEINYEADGRLTCKAKANSSPLYSSRAVGAIGPGSDGKISLVGDSLFVPLDIPVVDEIAQNAPGFVGVMTGYTEAWPGGLVIRSNDGGQTWTDLQAFAGKATLGMAINTLPASNCTLIDQRTLSVSSISGEWESITRDQMLSGRHYVAYGQNGRWEILRFQNAVLQTDGYYVMSGFVRGERGTEWATGLHQPGDYFVLLDDPDNAFIGVPVESLGLTRNYRGVTSGASIDSARDISFAYQGVNLECLSPVYAKGGRDGSGNFTGTFTRRSRLSSSWWSNGVQTPVGETTEAYEIDVMSGSTVKRTISASSPSFSYSAASQTTDFGSAQASITFRIYQLSSVVGRGYPLEVTL